MPAGGSPTMTKVTPLSGRYSGRVREPTNTTASTRLCECSDMASSYEVCSPSTRLTSTVHSCWLRRRMTSRAVP